MEWIKGFTYIFEDKKWFGKMFVGSLITSVPVVEAITNGYQMQVIENLKAGVSQPLPEWKNMDQMFGKGIKLWLAVNLFYIPSIIVSVVSWFLGIPLFIGLVSTLIASYTADNRQQAHDLYYILVKLVFPLLSTAVSGIAVFFGSIALPAVFVFVPVMAVRCQETNSFASTMNFYSHIKFVLKHLGDYVVARVLIAAVVVGMHIFAAAIGGATVWIAGLGLLLGWFLVAAGRFWSRLAWAYFLANMRMKETAPNNIYQFNQPVQNQPLGVYYPPVNRLTPTAEKQHYWENN